MKILWIGPLADPEQVARLPAVSAAAVNWQKSMLTAFSNLGCQVQALSYIAESSFPKGNLIPEASKFHLESIQTIPVQYLNISGIREYALSISAKAFLKNYSSVDVVITYNERIAHTLIAQYLRKTQKVYWVSVVADANFVLGADLYIFLSYQYYQKAKVDRKIHVDGGVDNFKIYNFETVANKRPIVLLFNGSLSKWTGIEKFALDFAKINPSGFLLKITGRGRSEIISELSKQNNNISYSGFLSEQDLDLERQNAFAFINPRPVEIKDGEKNFPSKILEYLSYGKPILSTQCPGLAPYYEDLIFYYDEENIFSLRETLNKLISLASRKDSIYALEKKIADFGKSHSWEKQVKRVINKIDQTLHSAD